MWRYLLQVLQRYSTKWPLGQGMTKGSTVATGGLLKEYLPLS